MSPDNNSLVMALQQAQIKLLAVDFDLTLVDTHTRGCWAGTVGELTSKARPYMKHLVDRALLADIHVAIVTFSPQVTGISFSFIARAGVTHI